MAEGGHPAPKEEDDYPKWNWDRGSLEYVFASDLIHFLIERENKVWRSEGLIAHRSPVTPFNTAIQDAVEGVLRQDSTCLSIVFSQITQHYKELSHIRFNMCAVFLKLRYFGSFDSFGSLLKYFSMIGLFAVWALKKDLHAAPFFCVDIIMGYLREFLVEHRFTNMDDFWYSFEQEARDALRLPNIRLLNDEELRCLIDLQKVTEETSEEVSSCAECSSKNLQLDEPELDLFPEIFVAETHVELSPEKENTKDPEVSSGSAETTGNVSRVTSAAESTVADEAEVASAAESTVADEAEVASAAESTVADEAEVAPAAKSTVADEAEVAPAAKSTVADEAKVAPAAKSTVADEAKVASAAKSAVADEPKVASATAKSKFTFSPKPTVTTKTKFISPKHTVTTGKKSTSTKPTVTAGSSNISTAPGSDPSSGKQKKYKPQPKNPQGGKRQ